jgi:hypothetical protein
MGIHGDGLRLSGWECPRACCVIFVCVCVEGAFDNLVAITMRDVNSRRVPTPGLDRHFWHGSFSGA